jgi:MFS family permease
MLKITRQPAFLVAVLSAMVGFSVMVLLMTATPIAMVQFDHAFTDAAFVIQWHAVAMFAPSFVTGTLINRVGVLRIILTGVVMMSGAVAAALSGESVVHFWGALFLLGIGWNFMFVGGTTLLTETYTVAERAKVEGTNDMIVFGSVAIASLMSGALLQSVGWQAVALGAIPFIAVAGIAAAALALVRRQTVPTAPLS